MAVLNYEMVMGIKWEKYGSNLLNPGPGLELPDPLSARISVRFIYLAFIRGWPYPETIGLWMEYDTIPIGL